jgi:choline dehydrogenase-like flavoprotein
VSNSTVDRVITDASNAATGVQLCDRTHIHADAVVLAAGAIHTPAILQRSGVSDAGRGLVDHPAVGFLLELRDDDAAVPGPGGGLGLVSSVIVERAGVQVLAINHLGPASPHQHAMLLVAVMDPVSPGGRVAVRSDDPAVAPDVDFALLSDKGDLERLATGVEFVRELLRTPPFADAVDRTYVDDVGTTIDELDSDDVIDRWMRTRGADYVHAACSSSTVVDEVGRVIGVDGLFVCDASAFPAIPDANTHLPTTMLAERFCAHWVDPRRA